MRKGDTVLVRTFLNQPIVRRVWAVHGDMVKICTDEMFVEWESKGKQPLAAEVSRDQVYQLDGALFERMKAYDGVIDEEPDELARLWEQAIKPLPA